MKDLFGQGKKGGRGEKKPGRNPNRQAEKTNVFVKKKGGKKA